MQTILYIGLSLFLCSAAAIYVTMRSASISDAGKRPAGSARAIRRKAKAIAKRDAKEEGIDNLPLADRRRLDDHARSLEGAVFFF